MPYYAPSKELAEKVAQRLKASRVGTATGQGRTVTDYIVKEYAHPDGRYSDSGNGRFEYGVVERWRYDDRPDLPEFGGAFVQINERDWS